MVETNTNLGASVDRRVHAHFARAPRGKLAISCAFSLLVIYLLLAPWNTALYDTVLFPVPDPRLVDITSQLDQMRNIGIRTKVVQIKSGNGNSLAALFLELPYTRRVFLYSHGKGNNITGKLHVARSLLACGGSVLMYDYQGYGRSQGRCTVQNACDDGVAAYDYLIASEHRTAHDIIGYGESFGSGVTGQLLKRRCLAGVIFQSGFASLKTAARDTLFWLQFYPDWMFPAQMMDNEPLFTRPHPPLLIIHGTGDRILKYSNALHLFNIALPSKMMLTVPGGNHGSNGGEKFYGFMRSFLQENRI